MRSIPQSCIDLVARFEGFSAEPYLCPAGYWTQGFGRVLRDKKGRMLRAGTSKGVVDAAAIPDLTREAALRMLADDLREYAYGVESLVKVPLTDGQFGALCSFAYNLGVGNLASSTLLRLLNQGRHAEAAMQFERWNKSDGQVLAGLTRRRLAERELFLS